MRYLQEKKELIHTSSGLSNLASIPCCCPIASIFLGVLSVINVPQLPSHMHCIPVLVHPVLFGSDIETSTLFEPCVPSSLLQLQVEITGHAGNLSLQWRRLEYSHQPSCVPGGASAQFPLCPSVNSWGITYHKQKFRIWQEKSGIC